MKANARLPQSLGIASIAIFFLLWGCSAIRHALLQSNAYDLGLFDQWIWLVSKGLPPYSTMEEGVHILADHGAWALYLASIPYALHSSVQWLFITQAAGLSFTAIPLWSVAKQAGLKENLCWLICGLWWLQPVVFNTNLFDFHPEVWGMPALASCYWASRAQKGWLWFFLLFLLLGCRDGLILVVAGLGLEQLIRKRWIWAFSALGISMSWLALLNRWLYPFLTGTRSGPKAASGLFSYLGNTFDEVLLNLFTKPNLLIENVDWMGGMEYLILICIAIAPFWKKASLPVLTAGIPLILVNLVSESSSQRSLIHHYSLPIAVIAVIGAIDGLAQQPSTGFPLKRLGWSALWWALLAKPWFFTGPYLSRLNAIFPAQEAMNSINKSSRVATTSYLVPHLSHRKDISFPKEIKQAPNLESFDVLLLNPRDPGWGSNGHLQKQLLQEAKRQGWECKYWESGLELCKEPSEIQSP